MPDDERTDAGAVGAESHADAHLLGALLDRVGHEAVDADGSEDKRGASEDGEEEHVKVLSRGGLDDDFGHGTYAGDRESAAGLAELIGDGGDVLVGIAVGADQPHHRADVGVEGCHAVGDLGAGNDHERMGIVVEATVAAVGDDADDLAGGLSELGADAFANEELLANGIVFRPVFFLHGLVDENDARGGTGVLLGEVPAAQDGYVEDSEVAWGSAHPAGAAVPWRFGCGGAADDVEGQAVAAFERKAAGEGGDFDAGNGIEALASVVGDLGDAGGLFELVAGEGHFEGEDVAGIKAGVDLAQSNEGADEERGSDEDDQGERDFADDQQGAGLVLAEAATGAVAAFLKGGVEIGA